MTDRQHATPVVVQENGDVRILRHVPLDAPPFREDGLQELLAAHPQLLPVGEIEPAFAPLICLGREIGTQSGPLDILYWTPKGYLTLVETKLWDNPQARREVVGQIVDYAKDLANWTYEELDAAVYRASGRHVLDHILDEDPDLSEAEYVENVSRNLRKARFLLLIAGNGIREGVVSMAKYLQQTPSLHFTLALVELALYRLNGVASRERFVQPRVVARTAEDKRAMVEIKAPDHLQVDISLPAEDDESRSKARRVLTEDAFYAELTGNTSAETADHMKALINNLQSLGIEPTWRSASVSMRLPDPADSGYDFTIVVFQTVGTFFVGWLEYLEEKGGYDGSLAEQYLSELTEVLRVAPKGMALPVTPLDRLFANRHEFLNVVERHVSRVRLASGSKHE